MARCTGAHASVPSARPASSRGEFYAGAVELAGRVKDNTIIRAKSLEVKLASDENKMQLMFGDVALTVSEAPQDAGSSKAPRAPKNEP